MLFRSHGLDWRSALSAAGRTVAVVLGGAGLGLIGGLAYGAWLASTAAPWAGGEHELVTLAGWLIALLLYGAIGFVAGLAAGLLIMVLTWIVRLARRLVAAARPG